MPEDFDRCVKGGGRVRTVSGPNKKLHLKSGEYCHVCYDSEGSHRGHTKTKERSKQVRKGKRG